MLKVAFEHEAESEEVPKNCYRKQSSFLMKLIEEGDLEMIELCSELIQAEVPDKWEELK